MGASRRYRALQNMHGHLTDWSTDVRTRDCALHAWVLKRPAQDVQHVQQGSEAQHLSHYEGCRPASGSLAALSELHEAKATQRAHWLMWATREGPGPETERGWPAGAGMGAAGAPAR